jgi:hypothetical protein
MFFKYIYNIIHNTSLLVIFGLLDDILITNVAMSGRDLRSRRLMRSENSRDMKLIWHAR